MVVIRSNEYWIAGLDKDSLLDFTSDKRRAQTFTDDAAAAAWWETNAPTLPALGKADHTGYVMTRTFAHVSGG